jgi:hypothetical protein
MNGDEPGSPAAIGGTAGAGTTGPATAGDGALGVTAGVVGSSPRRPPPTYVVVTIRW